MGQQLEASASRVAGEDVRHGVHAQPERHTRLVAVSLATAACGLVYTAYRAYYGFGGTVGMIGTPRSDADWRAVNLAGAAVLLVAAVVPVAAIPLWSRVRLRRVLLAVCWVAAVGCVMHALVADAQRVLSLAGVVRVHYPASMWASVDRHTADVQDLVLNETWFALEGLLWGALAWVALGRSAARRWWVVSAVVAVGVLVCAGLLSTTGVIGRFVVG